MCPVKFRILSTITCSGNEFYLNDYLQVTHICAAKLCIYMPHTYTVLYNNKHIYLWQLFCDNHICLFQLLLYPLLFLKIFLYLKCKLTLSSSQKTAHRGLSRTICLLLNRTLYIFRDRPLWTAQRNNRGETIYANDVK